MLIIAITTSNSTKVKADRLPDDRHRLGFSCSGKIVQPCLLQFLFLSSASVNIKISLKEV